MTTQLSTDIITHKLKIKGEGVKYISKSLAESIFAQLADPKNTTITIANPKTMTYITKYRSEIDLLPLTNENKDFEDILNLSGLSEEKKESVREIWEFRKKDKKPKSNKVLENIIESFKT